MAVQLSGNQINYSPEWAIARDIIRKDPSRGNFDFVTQKLSHEEGIAYLAGEKDLLGAQPHVEVIDCEGSEGSPAEFFIEQNEGKISLSLVPEQKLFTRSLLERITPLSKNAQVDIERLINAKVAVVGCGTVGTQIIEFLASSGLGNINLGDTDVISLANTQRVDIWTTSDVGKSKALVDSRYIFHKNPHLVQTVFNEGLTTHNVNDFIPEGTNVVISAVDDPQMMYLICARAKELEIPFILATDLDEAVVVDITDFSTHPEAELLFGRITGTKLNDIMAQIKVLEPYATNGDQAAINKIKVLKGNILRKIVKPTDASARMIKWFRGYVKGETGNEGLPQTHTAARQAGTYGGVAALGFILGQQITDHVKIDARQLLSPKKDNLSSSLQQKKQLLGLVGDVLRPKVTDALSKMRSKLLKQSLIRALANVMDLYNMLV